MDIALLHLEHKILNYAKIESDCIYIIFYEHGNINFIIKIRENLVKNPILYINDNLRKIEEFFKNNKEDKVFELFETYKSKELNLTDLAIYQIFDE
jgi:predicted AlkP superfamily phosphohydrolase/phosphomutase